MNTVEEQRVFKVGDLIQASFRHDFTIHNEFVYQIESIEDTRLPITAIGRKVLSANFCPILSSKDKRNFILDYCIKVDLEFLESQIKSYDINIKNLRNAINNAYGK